MLPAMGLFYVSDLMGGAKNLLIGNVIKVQFLNIRDWPFGAATSITLTIVMGLMLLVYWRASRLLSAGEVGHSISGAVDVSTRFNNTRYLFHASSNDLSSSVAISRSTASCSGAIYSLNSRM